MYLKDGKKYNTHANKAKQVMPKVIIIIAIVSGSLSFIHKVSSLRKYIATLLNIGNEAPTKIDNKREDTFSVMNFSTLYP